MEFQKIDNFLERYKEGLSDLEKDEIKKQSSGATNKYGFIIGEFVDEINKERKGTKWKKITAPRVARELQHLSLEDKEYFLHMCRKYKRRGKGAFGKCFFGSLKLRENKN